MALLGELRELIYVGGAILGVGYAIWKIEMQSKSNSQLIKQMDERHSLLLEKIQEANDRELEILQSRLDDKINEFEKLKSRVEAIEQRCNKKNEEYQMKMNLFIEKNEADKKYVSKMELQLELQKIDKKLDTLIAYFKGKRGGDDLPK